MTKRFSISTELLQIIAIIALLLASAGMAIGLALWTEASSGFWSPYLLFLSCIAVSALGFIAHGLIGRVSGRWQIAMDGLFAVVTLSVIIAFAARANSLLESVLLSIPVLACLIAPIASRQLGWKLTWSHETKSTDSGKLHAENELERELVEPDEPVTEREVTALEATNEVDREILVDLESEETEEDEADDAWAQQRLAMIRDPQISQYLGRWECENQDTCMALTRCSFEAGQKVASIQMPFWPFFADLPHCFVEMVDGPDAEVKVVENQPFGLKLEVVLKVPASISSSVLVEVIATAQSTQNVQIQPNHDAA